MRSLGWVPGLIQSGFNPPDQVQMTLANLLPKSNPTASFQRFTHNVAPRAFLTDMNEPGGCKIWH